jgi:hypothetical protein
MADDNAPRVFDSVTAAVANSAQPAPPPYAAVAAEPVTEEQTAPEEEVQAPAPPSAKAAPKTVGRKGQHVRAQAGTAEGTGAAKGPGE